MYFCIAEDGAFMMECPVIQNDSLHVENRDVWENRSGCRNIPPISLLSAYREHFYVVKRYQVSGLKWYC